MPTSSMYTKSAVLKRKVCDSSVPPYCTLRRMHAKGFESMCSDTLQRENQRKIHPYIQMMRSRRLKEGPPR